jgi:hypothetical protein
MLFPSSALVIIMVSALMIDGYLPPNPSLVIAAQATEKSTDKSLAGCPAPKPVLRIAGHFNEEFTPHPA